MLFTLWRRTPSTPCHPLPQPQARGQRRSVGGSQLPSAVTARVIDYIPRSSVAAHCACASRRPSSSTRVLSSVLRIDLGLLVASSTSYHLPLPPTTYHLPPTTPACHLTAPGVILFAQLRPRLQKPWHISPDGFKFLRGADPRHSCWTRIWKFV